MEETVEQKGQVSKSPNGWDFVYTKHVEYNVKIQKGTSQRVSNTTPIHAQRLFKKKKVFEKKIKPKRSIGHNTTTFSHGNRWENLF